MKIALTYNLRRDDNEEQAEFDSPKTQAAFALGLTLFLVTLFLNFIALQVVKKYTEKYD